jgi:hypothetical protein
VTAIPTSAVSRHDLRTALERRLGRGIRGLRRQPFIYTSSFVVEELEVQLDDGTELALLLKDLSPSALLESSRAAKPVFLYDPRREIETYRTILAHLGLGTAFCYATFADDHSERYWLVLEKVPGVELYQVGDVRLWQAAARWLADLHTRGAGLTDADAEAAHLLRYSAPSYRGWMQRAVVHALEPRTRDALEWLAKGHEQVVERLVALPQTFIHGECYASNVLVVVGDGPPRVCPVDWEMAAVGPGLMDLAALSAGRWTPLERQSLVDAYRQAFEVASGQRLPPDELDTALDCCRLQLAVQWLGWSPGWQPPLDHVQNWLGEALGAAHRLGL